jgi:hypothetical protein
MPTGVGAVAIAFLSRFVMGRTDPSEADLDGGTGSGAIDVAARLFNQNMPERPG